MGQLRRSVDYKPRNTIFSIKSFMVAPRRSAAEAKLVRTRWPGPERRLRSRRAGKENHAGDLRAILRKLKEARAYW